MKDFVKDLIRQTEILAFCLKGEQLSKADCAVKYDVTEITINRDMNALRQSGIPIYSRSGIIQIIGDTDENVLIKYAADYLPLKLNSDVFTRQVKVFVKSFKSNFFSSLCLISKAVNEGLILNLKYKRLYDDNIVDYILKPVRLICNDYNWILQAFKDGESILKIFYLSRIINLDLTDEKFNSTPLPQNSKNKKTIILQFEKQVEQELLSKIWFEDFEINKDENGNILLKTEQEITNKLASWCISWWDNITIREPIALKDYIEEMVGAFNSKNYW